LKTATLINTRDLIKQFVLSSFNADILTIEDLLAEDGVFELENKDLETIEGSKKEFMAWYKLKLTNTEITESKYDQCIGCSFGKQIVLFNNGTFPKKPNDFTERTKAGLMIEGSEGKISKIIFCFVFLKTDNKCVWECFGEEVVKNVKKGMTEEEAIEEYKNNPNSEYKHLVSKADQEHDEKEEGNNCPF